MVEKKTKLECCGCGCEKEEPRSQKGQPRGSEGVSPEGQMKLYFCPKCKSHDVGYIFQLKNIFGLMPKMKCKKCGFEAVSFPVLITSEKMLKRNLNKTKSKLNKKKVKKK